MHTSHVFVFQVSLEGVEASLSAKTRELQEVLGQLQAAAAQEFQDAKKLLLDEGESAQSGLYVFGGRRDCFKGFLGALGSV